MNQVKGSGVYKSGETLCFDANTLYPFFIAAMALSFQWFRSHAQSIAIFIVVPVLTIVVVVLVSLYATMADAGFIADGLLVLLVDVATIFVRSNASGRRFPAASAWMVLVLLYLKFAATTLFISYRPIGGIEAITIFYSDVFVLFLASSVLLFVRTWTSDAPADLAPRAHAVFVEAVLVLLFAKFGTAAAAAFISPCPTDGNKARGIIYLDVIQYFVAGAARLSVRIWDAPDPAGRAAHARLARTAIRVVFILAKFVAAAVFFSTYTAEEGIKADVVSFDPDILVLYAAATVFFVFEDI